MVTINNNNSSSYKDDELWLRIHPNNFVRFYKSRDDYIQEVTCIDGESFNNKINIINHIHVYKDNLNNIIDIGLGHFNYKYSKNLKELKNSKIDLYTTNKLNIINMKTANTIDIELFSNNKFIGNYDFLDLFYSKMNIDYTRYLIFIQLVLTWFSLIIPFEDTICITMNNAEIYYDNLNINRKKNIDYINKNIKYDLIDFFKCLTLISKNIPNNDIKILSHLSTPFVTLKIEYQDKEFKVCTLSSSYIEILFLLKQIDLSDLSKKILFELNTIYRFPYLEESLIKDFDLLDSFLMFR